MEILDGGVAPDEGVVEEGRLAIGERKYELGIGELGARSVGGDELGSNEVIVRDAQLDGLGMELVKLLEVLGGGTEVQERSVSWDIAGQMHNALFC